MNDVVKFLQKNPDILQHLIMSQESHPKPSKFRQNMSKTDMSKRDMSKTDMSKTDMSKRDQ